MKYIFFFLITISTFSQDIAVLKYSGGGDWYANPTSLPNLVAYCNQNIQTHINPKIKTVEPSSPEIYSYPFIHMTGHGNVVFSQNDLKNLKTYLSSGGFLHIDDNYGMDEFIRAELNKLFPDNSLVEIPSDHELFHIPYEFSNGLPKIHEHDKKRPQAFGIFIESRLALLYTYESDLGDGWEDKEIHNDSQEIREKALKMGANIIYYVFKN